MDSLLSPILMIMSGILVGVIIKSLQKYIKIPYTVVLFAIGLLVGYLYKYDILGAKGSLGGGMSLITGMNPDFILYVFLPILVFDTAYEMDLHVFNKTLFNSSVLAGPGVVVCMLLTGGLLMLLVDILGGYDNSLWKYALMFGGLISATDPIAVVALLKELGTSKRFSTLVDGEALLNDGTGIVCFMLFYSQFDGTGAIDRPFLFFVWVCAASCVIGYVMAKIALLLTTKVCKQEMVQNCVMIAAAYITFILAQKTLSVSGVIALVVFGYMFAHNGKTKLKPQVNEFMGKFWGLLTEIANTLIFLIVGVVIATQVNLGWVREIDFMQGQPDYAIYLFAFVMIVIVYVGLNLIRYIMIALMYPVLKRSGYGLSFKESLVLGWGGLRGAVAMTLALMVNCNPAIPQDVRGVILLLTAGTITLTLCINATTSKAMVRKLGLDKKSSSAEENAFRRVIGSIRRTDLDTIERLKADPELKGADWDAVRAKIVPEYISKLADSVVDSASITALVRYAMADSMFGRIDSDYSRGLVCHKAYLKLQDIFSVLQDFDGEKSLDELDLKFLTAKPLPLQSKRKHTFVVINSCRALQSAVERGREFLEYICSVMPSAEINDSIMSTVSADLDRLSARVDSILDSISKANPEIFAESLTLTASNKVLAMERDTIDGMCASGLLVAEDAELLKSDTDARQGIEIYD